MQVQAVVAHERKVAGINGNSGSCIAVVNSVSIGGKQRLRRSTFRFWTTPDDAISVDVAALAVVRNKCRSGG